MPAAAEKAAARAELTMPDIYDTHPTLYKLVSAGDIPDDAWANRNGWTSAFTKVPQSNTVTTIRHQALYCCTFLA